MSAEERLSQLKENAKNNSRRFYNNKYTYNNVNMTETDKEKVLKNIEERKEKLKRKYEENKEMYRARQKAYRDRKRKQEQCEQEQEQQKHIVSFD